MSLKALVAQTWQASDFWLHSVPAHYAIGAAQPIFNIVGGPVWIRALIEYLDTAVVPATTTTLDVGAVSLDAGALSILGNINEVVVSPLNAAVAKIAPALAVQMPSLLGFATNIGVVASPGVAINVTVAAFDLGAAELVSFYVCYQKLAPESLITLA